MAGQSDPLTTMAISRPSAVKQHPDQPSWGAGWKEQLQKRWQSSFSVDIEGESLPYEDQFLALTRCTRGMGCRSLG